MAQEIKAINLGGVNCYLVRNEAEFMLIDTGLSNKRSQLEKELLSAGCRPGNLKLILLTHGDQYHSGNCAYLREKYASKIAMHPAETIVAESGDMLSSRKNRPFLASLFLAFFKLNRSDRFKPDFTIEDGYDLSEYGFDARVLYLPGHSSGSIGILIGSGDLFCGDLLVNTKKPSRNSLVDNPQEMTASIERLRSLDIKTVYPGHGRPFLFEQLQK